MLPNVEVIDLAPGLWIWRLEHPAWNPDADWQQVVTCVCVDAGSERWLLDPLLPPDDATEVWDRLARRPPMAVAVLSPDHMRPTWGDRQTRSVDAVVRRYGCRAFGPAVFDPDDGPPETEVQTIVPNRELPGGLFALRDPRGWSETPLWLAEHRALVFADALTERAGVLRVWMSPTHEDRAIPDFARDARPSVRARDHLPWKTRAYARCVHASAGAAAVAGRASAPASLPWQP
jgi:hypothetical protein